MFNFTKIAAIAAIAMAAGSVSAQSVTFGQFSAVGKGRNVQVVSNKNSLTFKNVGGAMGVKVTFDDFTMSYNATLVLNAMATGPALVTGPNSAGQTTFSESLDGSFSFTEVGTGVNLLSATFTNAQLTGVKGSNSLTFNGNASSGGTVSYSSDLPFTFGDPNDFSWGITGTSKRIALNSAGYIAPLQGLTNGNFSTSPVPEAATWGMLIVGFGLVGVSARRRVTAVAA